MFTFPIEHLPGALLLFITSAVISYAISAIRNKWFMTFGGNYTSTRSGNNAIYFGSTLIIAMLLVLFMLSGVQLIIRLAMENLGLFATTLIVGALIGYGFYMFLYKMARGKNSKNQVYIWAFISIILALIYYFMRTVFNYL